jgi:hypothetical protein
MWLEPNPAQPISPPARLSIRSTDAPHWTIAKTSSHGSNLSVRTGTSNARDANLEWNRSRERRIPYLRFSPGRPAFLENSKQACVRSPKWENSRANRGSESIGRGSKNRVFSKHLKPIKLHETTVSRSGAWGAKPLEVRY